MICYTYDTYIYVYIYIIVKNNNYRIRNAMFDDTMSSCILLVMHFHCCCPPDCSTRNPTKEPSNGQEHNRIYLKHQIQTLFWGSTSVSVLRTKLMFLLNQIWFPRWTGFVSWLSDSSSVYLMAGFASMWANWHHSQIRKSLPLLGCFPLFFEKKHIIYNHSGVSQWWFRPGGHLKWFSSCFINP